MINNIIILFINIIIYLFIFLSSFLYVYSKYIYIKMSLTDILDYKIKSYFFSWFIAFSYIFFFIVLLYFLRIFKYDQTIDLKETFIYPLWGIYNSLEFIIFCYLSLLALILFSSFSLIFVKIHTFCIHHLIILNLFYNPELKHKIDHFNGYYQSIFFQIYDTLRDIGFSDVISRIFYNIAYNISNMINKSRGNIYGTRNYKPQEFHKYHKYNPLKFYPYLLDSRFQKIIIISPFILFIYECLIYNFTISLTFKYLLLYIPVMILKRITTYFALTSKYICYILWNILYKEEQNCIYAIPIEAKNLWEYTLKNKLAGLGPLEARRLTGNPLFEIDFSWNLLTKCHFVPYNNETELYHNNEIVCRYAVNELLREHENEIYSDTGEFLKTETIIVERWHILAKK